jgi:hypothetical protein
MLLWTLSDCYTLAFVSETFFLGTHLVCICWSLLYAGDDDGSLHSFSGICTTLQTRVSSQSINKLQNSCDGAEKEKHNHNVRDGGSLKTTWKNTLLSHGINAVA